MDRDAELDQINGELALLRARYASYRRAAGIMRAVFMVLTPLCVLAAALLAVKVFLFDPLYGVFFLGAVQSADHLCQTPTALDQAFGWAVILCGYSSHNRPLSSRPDFFLRFPPHCLKKKATPCSVHASRNRSTQLCCTCRARGPDSPPTITQ